jgi:hypothetical protein
LFGTVVRGKRAVSWRVAIAASIVRVRVRVTDKAALGATRTGR